MLEPNACKQCPNTPTTQTLAYYNDHAQSFADSTVSVEFSAMHEAFESLLPEGAKILDFGCGSGRDLRHFLEAGYDVTATDGSPEICANAERFAGVPVRCELFQDLAETDTYDGIWACSSILHLTKPDLADTFAKMVAALKSGGIVYTSFKYGAFEGTRNGRHFTDFTEDGFRDFLASIPALVIEQIWTSADVRPGRENEKWLNILLRKA